MASRSILLWSLFAIQAVCSAYFAYDALLDALNYEEINPLAHSELVENAATVALILSMVFTGSELRKTLRQSARLEAQIRVASGAFEAVVQSRFEDWRLTTAEKDVALLALKGCSMAEIAQMRGTALGTAKAQAAAVYRKAGVSGRLQLISCFVEDLMPGVTRPEDDAGG